MKTFDLFSQINTYKNPAQQLISDNVDLSFNTFLLPSSLIQAILLISNSTKGK